MFGTRKVRRLDAGKEVNFGSGGRFMFMWLKMPTPFLSGRRSLLAGRPNLFAG
jgi:hypothetical protein